MQTAELLDLMGSLKLRGMRSAFEETLSEGLKRKHSFHQIIGRLLAAEAEERRLRSIRYQLSTANLPLAKSLDTFQFASTGLHPKEWTPTFEVFYDCEWRCQMQRIPKRRYTAEFRTEAVKLVVEQGVGLAEAARRLDLPAKSVRAH